MTAWSAFGAFDWRSLLTRDERAYESGLFDVRASEPRATRLVPMVRALAATGQYDHPALDADRVVEERPIASRSRRFAERRTGSSSTCRQGAAADSRARGNGARSDTKRAAAARRSTARPVLIAGGSGTLGCAFGHLAKERGPGAGARSVVRSSTSPTRRRSRAGCDSVRPWAVVNTAGWVRVDDAERDRDGCMRGNTYGAECLARPARTRGIPLLTFSSDLVFGGESTQGDSKVASGGARPFVESDPVDPRNVYGARKAEAERRVLDALPGALVVRTSAFFGDWDDWNFVSRTLAALRRWSSRAGADGRGRVANVRARAGARRARPARSTASPASGTWRTPARCLARARATRR